MKVFNFDTSQPVHELEAAFKSLMRCDPDKVVFSGSSPRHEQQAREANIAVEVQSRTAQ